MKAGAIVLVLALAAFGGFRALRMARASQDVADDERVVFFATAGRLDADQTHWILPVHGWIYEPESSRIRKGAFALTLEKKYELTATSGTRDNFDRRANLFLADNERGKALQVQIGDATFDLEESGANGHFRTDLVVPLEQVERSMKDGVVSYRALLPEGDARQFRGSVRLIQPTGISVISDIDDTIKVTHVTSTRKMLEATFFADFVAAPGMSATYRQWAEAGAQFHFVSSSPWQLYEPLREFTERAGFPKATFHLKSIRMKDRSLANLFKTGLETKPQQIQSLLQQYPERRFVLVGDTGEQDPEVYADMLRAHPQQVLRAYLRNVSDLDRSAPRLTSAFAGIQAERWELFTDPSSLELPE